MQNAHCCLQKSDHLTSYQGFVCCQVIKYFFGAMQRATFINIRNLSLRSRTERWLMILRRVGAKFSFICRYLQMMRLDSLCIAFFRCRLHTYLSSLLLFYRRTRWVSSSSEMENLKRFGKFSFFFSWLSSRLKTFLVTKVFLHHPFRLSCQSSSSHRYSGRENERNRDKNCEQSAESRVKVFFSLSFFLPVKLTRCQLSARIFFSSLSPISTAVAAVSTFNQK